MRERGFAGGQGAAMTLGLMLGLAAALPERLFSQSDEMRVWRDAEGREMRATLLDADGDSARFRLPNGSWATVPLAKLSEGDQSYIEDWQADSAFWFPVPRSRQWPDRVSVNWLESEVTVIQEGVDGKYVYHSPHFEFEANDKLAPNVVTDFAKLFEVTHAALEENPLGLRPYKPETARFKVRLFSDNASYQRAGGMLGAAGVYVPSKKWILVPFRSLGLVKARNAWVRKREYDPTTLIHETVHQVLDQWLPYAPIWFNEGLANFLSVARYQSGYLIFKRIGDGVKGEVRGEREHRNPILGDGPGGSVLFPIEIRKVLDSSRAGFMGFHPEAPLELAEISHHYQTALLLVHYFFYEDKHGPARLRAYLAAYKEKITENGGAELDFPENQDDEEELRRILERMAETQSEAARHARPALAAGRSEEELFESMKAFFGPLSIHLTKRSDAVR